MSTIAPRPFGADSLPEIPSPPENRSEDIEFKHDLVAQFLESSECDALLLTLPENMAWFTSGGDFRKLPTEPATAAVFITPDARVIVTDNVRSPLIFETIVPQLGFQLKERPWQQPLEQLIQDLCRGRKVASDTNNDRTHDAREQLQQWRMRLTQLDQERSRILGKLLVHGIEATARNSRPLQTEAEIAGEVAHRLVKRKLQPLRIQVCADGINARHRDWTYSDHLVRNYVTIKASATRWGLCVSASRTLAFRSIPDEVQQAHADAMLLQATSRYFTQAKWQANDTWQRVQRIYEKFGHSYEWHQAEQGAIAAYQLCEQRLPTRTGIELQPGMLVRWHPSVNQAMVDETILVRNSGAELITPVEFWPTQTVVVKGHSLECPDILLRDARESVEFDSRLPDGLI